MSKNNNISPDSHKKSPEEKDEDVEHFDIEDDVPTEEDASDFEEDFRKGRIIHIIFLLLIVVIVGVAVYELYKWNKGVPSGYDPTEDSSAFDYETEDFILELGPSALEGHVDDGINTILFLGDDYLAEGKGEDSIPDMVAEKLEDSVVINGSFNGTTMSTLVNMDVGFSPETPSDAFTPYWIINALALKDFTLMKYSLDLEALTIKDDDYASTVFELEELDLSTVDVLVLMYGTNDYMEDRLITDVNDLSGIYSFSGALQTTLTKLKEEYPYIRIIYSSPTISFRVDEDGNTVDTSLYNNGQNTLPGYAMAAKATITGFSYVSYVDNYYKSEINSDNYQTYLTDNWHLNATGREVIATKLASVIDGSYAVN